MDQTDQIRGEILRTRDEAAQTIHAIRRHLGTQKDVAIRRVETRVRSRQRRSGVEDGEPAGSDVRASDPCEPQHSRGATNHADESSSLDALGAPVVVRHNLEYARLIEMLGLGVLGILIGFAKKRERSSANPL